MNFLDGGLAADDEGGLAFAREGLSLPMVDLAGEHLGRHVTLGLRAEDAVHRHDGGALISGRVTLISPLGSEQYVNIAKSAGEIMVRLAKTDKVAGDRIELSVDPRRLHAVDQATDKSLHMGAS